MPALSPTLVKRARLAAGLALLAALLGFCGWMWGAHWRPRVTEFPVQGVDVGEDDASVDWWAVRNAGARFGYIVATVGANHRDSRFPENWRNSREAGLQRGAMHVYSLCQPASEQGGNFVSTVSRSVDQLPPAVVFDFHDDCEERPARGKALSEISHFLEAIETHLGRRAVLKISKAFDKHYGLSGTTTRQLWAQQPFFPPGYFDRPWVLWQASGFRRVEGVEKPINWDVMAQ